MQTLKEFLRTDRFASCTGVELLEINRGMRVHVCWLRNDISTVEGCAREEPCLHWLIWAFAAVANSHRRLTLSVTANITFLRPAKSGYVYADAAEVF